MSRMDEEQAIFGYLILNDFKMCSSTALKTFNSYNVVSIIMTSDSDSIKAS